MAPEDRWYIRLRDRALKLWRTENPRMAIARDIAAAAVIVGLLLATIWIYAGQPLSQAPVVSVESGSMMHGPHRGGKLSAPTSYGDPSFGRLGTIDPGDIVFVKRVDGPDDVETAFDHGRRSGYGGHGDVIVFMPNGSGVRTRVIHRAMLFVEAVPEGCTPEVDCTFRIPAACDPQFSAWAGGANTGKYCAGSSDLITLRLEREGLSLTLTNFPCWGRSGGCERFYSSFLTKGDNNDLVDQDPHVQISAPVRLDWVIGKARGEIPWFGLIKLALYGNPSYQDGGSDPTRGSNWTILRATAPWDIWMSLFLALAVLVSIPMLLDYIGNVRAKRREERERERRDLEAKKPPPRPPETGR